jgi:hypothetical protein
MHPLSTGPSNQPPFKFPNQTTKKPGIQRARAQKSKKLRQENGAAAGGRAAIGYRMNRVEFEVGDQKKSTEILRGKHEYRLRVMTTIV